MLLPTTYGLTLALLVISMLCWGVWANTFKKSLWRFELYYIDFCLGALLAALVAAFTIGSMGTDLSVQDSFLLVSKRPILLAFAAGCVFNLANMLIIASVEVSGMSVAFPVGAGLALIVGVIWNYVTQQTGNIFMLFGGSLLVLIAVIVCAVAYGAMEGVRRKEAAALAASMAPPEEAAKATAQAARRKRAEEESGPGALLGVWLALAGGLLLGAFYPLVTMSMEGELGFSNPFAVTLIFSIGMLISTLIYNLYFMNLPVRGLPISFFTYFTGTIAQHGLGLLGGIIWMLGTCANYAALAAQGEAKVDPAIGIAIGQSAMFVSLISGLFIWKEFAGATSSVTRLMGIMSLLFLAGLGLVAFGRVG